MREPDEFDVPDDHCKLVEKAFVDGELLIVQTKRPFEGRSVFESRLPSLRTRKKKE